ncbi:MAG: YfcE family phosphodiesterase [Flavobacteriaceae bacterium]|nr:YfcE family phosphodiesterase [Flavobacteriaceae bacterium]
MKKILLLSDTHGHLDDKIIKYVNQADEVWHAGDIGKKEIINYLTELKPLKAVFGNIDDKKIRLITKEFLYFNYEKNKILITHIAGYPGKYNKNVNRLISIYEPNILVCGHSHILKVMYDKKNKHLHLNPGAAGISGFHNIRTMLRFKLDSDKIKELEIIELGKR